MDAYVTVHPKYMVVIPKAVREKAHLGLGDRLKARFKGGEIILTPTREGRVEERVKAINELRHAYRSSEIVPDEVILDPLEYADPEDLR
jgi:AbrB family looped-hinge helix DNA binding protein